MRDNHSNLFHTPEGALSWMLENDMIIRSTTRDPETLATVRGFILSDEFGQSIGTSLLELFTKATGRKKNGLKQVTVRDAFLMATIAAVLRKTKLHLSEEEMELCAGILVSLLPIDRLARAGIADQTLRNIAHDRTLVRKIQHVFTLI
jgi:hypothetical protein